MDGVLIDSTKYIWDSFNQLLAKYGVSIGKEEIKSQYLGRSLRDQIKMFRETYHIEENINAADFSREAAKIEFRLMGDKITKDVDILKLITSAKAGGIKIAVATSSTRPRAEKILRLLGVFDLLDAFVTVEDVEKHKPFPDIYLKASETLKVKPKACIVFEDSLEGIESAKKANMKVVGLVTDYHTRKELHEANLVIDAFSRIDISTLQRMLGNRTQKR